MVRRILIWAALSIAVAVPVAAAAASPLLAWRGPAYIAAGFAGVAAMALLLLQPLLAGGYLPGLAGQRGRRAHRAVGAVLVAAVAIHVAGLWITSPPDMLDALFLRSPTLFTYFGVTAMWAVFAAALVAALRRRVKVPVRVWRSTHAALAATTAATGIAHAVLIEGTMETVSKVVLCALVVAATAKVVIDLRVWTLRPRRQP